LKYRFTEPDSEQKKGKDTKKGKDQTADQSTPTPGPDEREAQLNTKETPIRKDAAQSKNEHYPKQY
jgi:hypothetical protein